MRLSSFIPLGLRPLGKGRRENGSLLSGSLGLLAGPSISMGRK